MAKICGIYRIQSKSCPDKYYIGSSVDVFTRWGTHIRKLKSNEHCNRKLQNHYNKYGVNDLMFCLVVECGKDDVRSLEQMYLDILSPPLNLAKKVIYPSAGIELSEEGEKRRAEACYTRVVQLDLNGNYINEYESIKEAAFVNDLNAKKISSCASLNDSMKAHGGFLWVKKSDYENGYIPSYKPPKTKIYQYTLDGIFVNEWGSVKEAARYFGIDDRKIHCVSKNESSYVAGFQWRYYKKNKISKYKYRRVCVPKPVNQYDLKGNFIRRHESIKEALDELGKKSNDSGIVRACKGKATYAHGYKWAYAEEPVEQV